jgi:Transposase DDE domain group 1
LTPFGGHPDESGLVRGPVEEGWPDCLADLALLRAEPGVYGRVASDPTVSRAITALAAEAPAAWKAIDTASAAAREQAWRLAGEHAPDHGSDAQHPLIIDLDATLVTAHSEKEHAAPTFKRGFGFHPLCAFGDHGRDGTGEAMAILLRPGNASSNTAADHISVIRQALAQLPANRPGQRPGRKILVRTDGAGGTKALIEWLTGQRLSYSVGFTPYFGGYRIASRSRRRSEREDDQAPSEPTRSLPGPLRDDCRLTTAGRDHAAGRAPHPRPDSLALLAVNPPGVQPHRRWRWLPRARTPGDQAIVGNAKDAHEVASWPGGDIAETSSCP